MEKIDVKKVVMGDLGTSQTVEVSEDITKLDFPNEIAVDNVKGTLKIIRLDDTLLLTGELSSPVDIKCDRCLEGFNKEIDFTIEREYEINRLKESDENLFVDKYLTIDITESVREELLMAIPMKNICTEDCKGISY